MITILKYTFLLACALSVISTQGQNNTHKTFSNPLLMSGPDPWVIQHDNLYYFTRTTGRNLQIIATNKMSQLAEARPVTVWTPPDTGNYSKEIWAPELHRLENKWYIYFAADDGNNSHHRIYVLENSDRNPLSDNWILKGKICDITDKWAIDATVFTYKNQNYIVWSGWEGDDNVSQNIYIAKLANPWTIDGARTMISRPEYEWEMHGSHNGLPKVNEGPEVLKNKKGNIFLTYSASGCWTDDYSLGMLSLKNNGDPMKESDWVKRKNPVFSKTIENSVYGPGHNGFFKSLDGKEDWIVYHANPKSGQGCANYRSVRMQKITWNKDGSPNFGVPQKTEVLMPVPSSE